MLLPQSEALEELLGLEDPGKPATQLPRLLLEHRALDKLLSGFVAVSRVAYLFTGCERQMASSSTSKRQTC